MGVIPLLPSLTYPHSHGRARVWLCGTIYFTHCSILTRLYALSILLPVSGSSGTWVGLGNSLRERGGKKKVKNGHWVELLERKRVGVLVLQLTSSETYWYGRRRCALLRHCSFRVEEEL